MFYIFCPYCQEKREEIEFSYSDEAFITRPKDPKKLNAQKWADYLFNRNNPKGECFEQWCHTYGCRKFFIIERNNINNEIIASFTLAQIPKIKRNLKKKQ